MIKNAPTIESARDAKELFSALTDLHQRGQISSGQTRYESDGSQVKLAVKDARFGAGNEFTLFYGHPGSKFLAITISDGKFTSDIIEFRKHFGDSDPLIVAKDLIDTLRNGSQNRPIQEPNLHMPDLVDAVMPKVQSPYEISTPKEAFEKLVARLGDQHSVSVRCPENIMDYVAIRRMSDKNQISIEQSNLRYDGEIYSVEVRADSVWMVPGDKDPSFEAEQRSLKTLARWLSNYDSWNVARAAQ